MRGGSEVTVFAVSNIRRVNYLVVCSLLYIRIQAYVHTKLRYLCKNRR